jgi:hypothetical protein
MKVGKQRKLTWKLKDGGEGGGLAEGKGSCGSRWNTEKKFKKKKLETTATKEKKK